jgi:hypothetical protein
MYDMYDKKRATHHGKKEKALYEYNHRENHTYHTHHTQKKGFGRGGASAVES